VKATPLQSMSALGDKLFRYAARWLLSRWARHLLCEGTAVPVQDPEEVTEVKPQTTLGLIVIYLSSSALRAVPLLRPSSCGWRPGWRAYWWWTLSRTGAEGPGNPAGALLRHGWVRLRT
jgi:hypothetical protein